MNLKNITKQITPVAGIAAGMIAAKKGASLIPVGNDLVKGGLVTVLGLVLTGQKGMVSSIGLGMAAQGILSLVGNFVPGITGMDTVYIQGAPTGSQTDSGADNAPGYSY
jgi:hypothetical protein